MRFLLTLVTALSLACSGCATRKRHFGGPIATDASLMKLEGITIHAKKRADKVHLTSLAEALIKIRESGHSFDWIRSIEFLSDSEASVAFLWSGGYHEGFFSLVRESGKWTLRDEAYIL